MRIRATVLFVFALVLGVPAVGAPAPDDKPAEQTTTPYYPLKVGNTWTYKAGDTTVTVTVAKFEEISKQNCARLESSSAGGKPTLVEDVAVKADGVYRYGVADKTVEPPVKILALPPKKDETWKIDATIGTETLKGSFKSGEEAEVKVPAGTFKDVITITGADIDANGRKISMTYYFAKDFGIIKQRIKIGDAAESVVFELEKFESGKAEPGK
jgi:hypothetical protein